MPSLPQRKQQQQQSLDLFGDNEPAVRAAPVSTPASPPKPPVSQDYIFSLLTGYVDPPAGVEIREGLHYNPYFPGGALGMGRVLYDGLVEYDDGTPATLTQMEMTHKIGRASCRERV